MYTGNIAATSNRIAWSWIGELVDPDTNDFVDLAGAAIEVAVRQRPSNSQTPPTLVATIANGKIVVTGVGLFTVTFPKSEMAALFAGDYDVGVVLTLADGSSHQLFAGFLPVVDGVVSQ